MEAFTEKLWAKQDRHQGDRLRLFTAVADAIDVGSVLYPGSYVDIAPSFVFDTVTYVDVDGRAARFFDDRRGVDAIVDRHRESTDLSTWQFVHADYTDRLDAVPMDEFDLLISLYAGFVSEHCTEHLRVGGHLLVNPSHGDAAMASIDDRYELAGVVQSRNGDYRVTDRALRSYLHPKASVEVSRDLLHDLGRGIGYTKSPFAYLFRRIS